MKIQDWLMGRFLAQVFFLMESFQERWRLLLFFRPGFERDKTNGFLLDEQAR